MFGPLDLEEIEMSFNSFCNIANHFLCYNIDVNDQFFLRNFVSAPLDIMREKIIRTYHAKRSTFKELSELAFDVLQEKNALREDHSASQCKLCFNCLSQSHVVKNCKSRFRCYYCKAQHFFKHCVKKTMNPMTINQFTKYCNMSDDEELKIQLARHTTVKSLRH
ncbi:unnamed protein product [Caenorhabditis nigoni]